MRVYIDSNTGSILVIYKKNSTEDLQNAPDAFTAVYSSSWCELFSLTGNAINSVETTREQVIAPGAARRYAPTRRWQFDSRRIYIRPRTGPQSAHG